MMVSSFLHSLLWFSSFVRSGYAAAPGRSQQTIEVRAKRITPESFFPLYCPEPYFISISALPGQKVETASHEEVKI